MNKGFTIVTTLLASLIVAGSAGAAPLPFYWPRVLSIGWAGPLVPGFQDRTFMTQHGVEHEINLYGDPSYLDLFDAEFVDGQVTYGEGFMLIDLNVESRGRLQAGSDMWTNPFNSRVERYTSYIFDFTNSYQWPYYIEANVDLDQWDHLHPNNHRTEPTLVEVKITVTDVTDGEIDLRRHVIFEATNGTLSFHGQAIGEYFSPDKPEGVSHYEWDTLHLPTALDGEAVFLTNESMIGQGAWELTPGHQYEVEMLCSVDTPIWPPSWDYGGMARCDQLFRLPEPSSASMLVTGVVALALLARRRKGRALLASVAIASTVACDRGDGDDCYSTPPGETIEMLSARYVIANCTNSFSQFESGDLAVPGVHEYGSTPEGQWMQCPSFVEVGPATIDAGEIEIDYTLAVKGNRPNPLTNNFSQRVNFFAHVPVTLTAEAGSTMDGQGVAEFGNFIGFEILQLPIERSGRTGNPYADAIVSLYEQRWRDPAPWPRYPAPPGRTLAQDTHIPAETFELPAGHEYTLVTVARSNGYERDIDNEDVDVVIDGFASFKLEAGKPQQCSR
ncbi:MAG: hypothetical protein WBG86_14550 [Polyangiales bacterium]